jgi:membrane-bound lytic murein transglycosylase MltF
VAFTLVDYDAALWEAAHGHQNIAVAFAVGPRAEIGWAVARKDQDLRDAIQKFFDSQSQVDTSELNTIWKEEFGTTLKQFQALIQATR